MNHQMIEQLKTLVDSVPAKILHIGEEAFAFKPSPEKWSKKQELGHLIDSGMNNLQRFVRMQYEHVPTVMYNQDQWNAINNYQELPTEHIIILWQSVNRQIIHTLAHAGEKCQALLCDTGLEEPKTFAFLMDDYLAHMEHHLNHILQK